MNKYSPDDTGIHFPEHTADVWIQASAPDLSGLFKRMLNGLYLLISDEYSLKGYRHYEGEKMEGALDVIMVDFLSELLYLLDGEDSIILEPDIDVNNEKENYILSITGKRYICEPISSEGGVEVKAITHHGSEVKKTGDGYISRILVDI